MKSSRTCPYCKVHFDHVAGKNDSLYVHWAAAGQDEGILCMLCHQVSEERRLKRERERPFWINLFLKAFLSDPHLC